jgi:hypothetical protein
VATIMPRLNLVVEMITSVSARSADGIVIARFCENRHRTSGSPGLPCGPRWSPEEGSSVETGTLDSCPNPLAVRTGSTGGNMARNIHRQ